MTRKIRPDLVGVVTITTEAGVVILAAGDQIPDGIEVGDHLVAEPEAAETPKPGRRSRQTQQ